MNEEHLPVDASEFVYRRIHRSFLDPALELRVQPAAFRPNENDRTGLSVFRARFVQPAGTLANVLESKRAEYVIARIAVEQLTRLGLTVIPEPDLTGPPGHAIIPELAWDAYNADKKRLKDIQHELALLASRDIVYPTRVES